MTIKNEEIKNGLIVDKDGTEEYWEHGEQITHEESLRRKEIKDLKQTLTNTLPKSSIKSSLNKI